MERKRLGERHDTELNHGNFQLGKYNIPGHLCLYLKVLNVVLLLLVVVNLILLECA